MAFISAIVGMLPWPPDLPRAASGKPLNLKRKFWPSRITVRHNDGMPIVLGRRAMKRERLARKKARAKARIVAARQRRTTR